MLEAARDVPDKPELVDATSTLSERCQGLGDDAWVYLAGYSLDHVLKQVNVVFDRMFQPRMVFSPLNPGTEKVSLFRMGGARKLTQRSTGCGFP